MAKKPKWPPVPSRHASGQARVRLPGGKDVYLGVYGSPEAAEALRQLVEQAERQQKVAPTARAGLSVSEAVNRWTKEALPEQSAGEQSHYRRALTVLVRVCGGALAADFDAEKLQAVRDAMASGSWLHPDERAATGAGGRWRRRGGSWDRRVCNRQATRVKTVWRWLERKGLVPRGSWAQLRTLPALGKGARGVRQEKKRAVPSTRDVIGVAVTITRGPARLMLLLQLWSGMRSGEVRGMRWSEIDQAGPAWVYRPAQHKNAWRGQDRSVALGPKCQALLGLACKLRAKGPHADLVFPCRTRGRGRVTGPYSTSAYGWTVKRAALRAGLAGFRPYDCRHAFRLRISRAYGLDAARAAMGHTSVETTSQYAAGVDLSAALDVARRAG